MRFYVFGAWLLYGVFVIYGSLVPLNFQPRPLDEAIDAFRNIRYLDLDIGSRADWVANVLLFVPLAFLTLMLWGRFKTKAGRVIASVGTWLFAVALCIAIEFVQLFFPPRTVSQNDIIAESSGALIGIALHWLFGGRLYSWLAGWFVGSERKNYLMLYLQLYVGALIVYNIMPLDLSLSMAEIYRKWAAGRVLLVPFSFSYASTTEMLYGRGTDMAIWIPVAALLVVNGWSRGVAVVLTVGCAVGIEFLQLFVYSRVTDVTQVIMAASGAWLGTSVAKRLDATTRSAGSFARTYSDRAFAIRQMTIWGGLLLAWTVILAVVFWYPYDFNLNRDFVIERAKNLLSSVPFQRYYYGSEYRAITEFIHKTVFFVPCGIAAAMLGVNAPFFRDRGYISLFVALVLIGGIAIVIDVGRFLVPTKALDLADGFLQVGGGLTGYWGTLKYRASLYGLT